MEASHALPHRDIPLETQDATYYHFKSDILGGQLTYSTDKHAPVNCVTISARRASEVIAAKGERKLKVFQIRIPLLQRKKSLSIW